MQSILSHMPPGFTTWDFLAVAIVLVSLPLTNWLIEDGPWSSGSMSKVMQDYRMIWMAQMIRRENRMMDASLLATIRQGTAFYASTSMIAIGGLAALIGQAETVQALASDLILAESGRRFWEIKLLFPFGMMVYAFLKFAWAHRLFGYCAVLMGAVAPIEVVGDEAERIDMARRAALLNISASRSFNRGLRAVYFTLATLAWALGPLALLIALVMVILMLLRREFVSRARDAIGAPPKPPI